jgi:hypothetical protein
MLRQKKNCCATIFLIAENMTIKRVRLSTSGRLHVAKIKQNKKQK